MNVNKRWIFYDDIKDQSFYWHNQDWSTIQYGPTIIWLHNKDSNNNIDNNDYLDDDIEYDNWKDNVD